MSGRLTRYAFGTQKVEKEAHIGKKQKVGMRNVSGRKQHLCLNAPVKDILKSKKNIEEVHFQRSSYQLYKQVPVGSPQSVFTAATCLTFKDVRGFPLPYLAGRSTNGWLGIGRAARV